MFRILRKPLLAVPGLLRPSSGSLLRFASTGQTRDAYHPVKKIDFQGKNSLLILSRPEEDGKSRTIPYQIKECTFKNALGVMVGYLFEFSIANSLFGPLVISGFCINWVYQLTRMAFSLVPEIELSEDGSRATFRTILGDEHNFNVEDIQKLKDEKDLVETFEEPAMYPVKVEGQTFYLLVEGQESIKDGELFRAIINGRRVQF